MPANADPTVAIVAVLTTGVVGVLAPLVTAWFARSKQTAEHAHTRELDDVAERRRVLIDAVETVIRYERALSEIKPKANTVRNGTI